MSYIRTKLSKEDKVILKNIYEELEDINIPTAYSSKGVKGHFHSVKTGANTQKNARQTSFGIVNYRGKKVKSKSTKKYPWIMPLFKEFMQSHYPEFKFKSVYVNKNVVVKKHLDSGNVGESLLVGLGPYTGGKTFLYLPDGKVKKCHIKSQSLIFNGSEIPHKSEKFKGTRYSLVFFK
jgi:hypothetical protein